MGKFTTIDDLMCRIVGDWAGEEEMLVGPEQGGTMKTSAVLSNSMALGGRGYVSDYTQSYQGAETIRCVTVFNFGSGDEFTAMWTPTEGTSQIYAGHRSGYSLSMSAKSPDGSIQTIVTDYSHAERFSTRMLMTPLGGESVQLFEGSYSRKAQRIGQPLWRDLTVPEPETLVPFYEQVVGWRSEPVKVEDHTDFHMLSGDGEIATGICHALGPNEGLPPVWLSYFEVDSSDRAAEEAVALGGKVVAGPSEFGPYKYYVVEDPYGIAFAVCEVSS